MKLRSRVAVDDGAGVGPSELNMAKGSGRIDKAPPRLQKPPKPTTPKPLNVSLVETPDPTTRVRSTPSPFVEANSPASRDIERRASRARAVGRTLVLPAIVPARLDV